MTATTDVVISEKSKAALRIDDRPGTARSARLDARLGREGLPFRHLLGNALAQAVRALADHLEAGLLETLTDLGAVDDRRRLLGETLDDLLRRGRRREKRLKSVGDEVGIAHLDQGWHLRQVEPALAAGDGE